MQLELTGHSWFSDSAWKTETEQRNNTGSPVTHDPGSVGALGLLHGVSMISTTGTADTGQKWSSMATALIVFLHLLPRQSLLTHTGTICLLLQLKPNAGGISRDFCTPWWFALSLFSDLLFVLYSNCVTEYLTAIFGSLAQSTCFFGGDNLNHSKGIYCCS